MLCMPTARLHACTPASCILRLICHADLHVSFASAIVRLNNPILRAGDLELILKLEADAQCRAPSVTPCRRPAYRAQSGALYPSCCVNLDAVQSIRHFTQ
jgi:hypothetical protein